MRLHHRLEGPPGAPVVALAHALGASGDLWEAHVEALRPRYRALTWDARGHGRSPTPPGPYTLEQMADDLRDLLAGLGVARTHLVGLSMGGLMGMRAALRHPDLIQSLTLVDTTACYGPALSPMWEDRIRIAEQEGMTEALVERTLAIWFTPGFRAREPEAVDRVRRMLSATDPVGYAASIRAIGFVDLRDEIGAIRCPTLIMVGEQDPGTTPAMAREIQERIPAARLVVLPGAAHCSPVEAEAAFVRELLGFLAGAGAGPAARHGA